MIASLPTGITSSQCALLETRSDARVTFTDESCTCGCKSIDSCHDCATSSSPWCTHASEPQCRGAPSTCTRTVWTYTDRTFVFAIDTLARRVDNATVVVQCPDTTPGAHTVWNDPRCALKDGWHGRCWYRWVQPVKNRYEYPFQKKCGTNNVLCEVGDEVFAPQSILWGMYKTHGVHQLPTYRMMIFSALTVLLLVEMCVFLPWLCIRACY